MRYVAIFDIGKTNAKLILVDLKTQSERAVKKTPNRVVDCAPYPHHDLKMLWDFFKQGLYEFSKDWQIDAINISAHGAGVILTDDEGNLTTPMLDYEFSGLDEVFAEYDAIKPDFSETGSPHLAKGLNLGVQLFWLFKTFPELKEKTTSILTYPQYWSYLLSGVKTCEVTSLGCHTDLWDPINGNYSSLIEKLGIQKIMPPVHKAGDKIGALLPALRAELGIDREVPIYCGIHDSNASLVPHLFSQKNDFSVISTGTWVIAMAMGGQLNPEDANLDTLLNVNAFGKAVASSRFMGGREFELLMSGYKQAYNQDEKKYVLENDIAYYPARENSCGPYKGRIGHWSHDEQSLSDGQRMVAVSYYLALVTSKSLSLIGHKGAIIIEGPFAKNECFISMLGAIMNETIYVPTNSESGTAIGAAALIMGADKFTKTSYHEYPASKNPRLQNYAKNWNAYVQPHGQ